MYNIYFQLRYNVLNFVQLSFEIFSSSCNYAFIVDRFPVSNFSCIIKIYSKIPNGIFLNYFYGIKVLKPKPSTECSIERARYFTETASGSAFSCSLIANQRSPVFRLFQFEGGNAARSFSYLPA